MPLWPWMAIASLGILGYYAKNISEYNHLAVIFVLGSCIFLIRTAREKSGKPHEAIWQGILFGLLMSVKISAGLLWSIAVWIWWLKSVKKFWWAGVIAQAISYLLVCVVSGSGIFSLEKHPALYVFEDFNTVLRNWFSIVGLESFLPEKSYFLIRLAVLNSVEVIGLIILLGFIFLVGRRFLNKNLYKAGKILICIWISAAWIFFFYGGNPRQSLGLLS